MKIIGHSWWKAGGAWRVVLGPRYVTPSLESCAFQIVIILAGVKGGGQLYSYSGMRRKGGSETKQHKNSGLQIPVTEIVMFVQCVSMERMQQFSKQGPPPI